MATSLVEIAFHGDIIRALYDHRTRSILVVCRYIAENLGLDWASQNLVLSKHRLLGKYLTRCDITTSQGQVEVVCLPHKYLAYWLAGIQIKRVRSDIQDKLLLYQEECAEVLHQHFFPTSDDCSNEPPVHSTLDIIKFMHQEQLLLIQEVERYAHITDGHTNDIVLLRDTKADKSELEYIRLQIQEEKQSRKWHAVREFPNWVKHWIWDEAGGRCMKCHCKLNPLAKSWEAEAPEYDHILPKSEGGLGTVDNCQLLCKQCNSKKKGYADYRPIDVRERAAAIEIDRKKQREQEWQERNRQQNFGF